MKKTIYNEIARGMCVQQTSEYKFVERYCADVAERKYQEHLRAKGPDIKLGKDFAFVEYILNNENNLQLGHFDIFLSIGLQFWYSYLFHATALLLGSFAIFRTKL